MRHSWISEVLSDLRRYAVANDMPRLAVKVAEAETVAREEIFAKLDRDNGENGGT